MATTPTEPHLIRTLQDQILAHPRYAETSSSFKFAFGACVGGLSWATKQNNAWCRQVWRHLYLGTPMPKGNEIFDSPQ
jgi:hypothetical protein